MKNWTNNKLAAILILGVFFAGVGIVTIAIAIYSIVTGHNIVCG